MGKKRNPVLVMVFSVLTLGIYFFVWFYKTNEELNEISGENFNSLLWTLSFLIPIFGLMGIYLFAEHLHKAQSKKRVKGRSVGVYFLLVFISPLLFVGLPFVQKDINQLW